jgi:hypothetical protein
VCYRRQRWDTPDGDFIDVDFVDPPKKSGQCEDSEDSATRHAGAQMPLVVLFHGLEGSSASIYARAMAAATRARGWACAVVHFRGCSGEPNRLARAYHSGDSDEIDWVLQRFRRQYPASAPIYSAGVSLGGNALLKWLGERGSQARQVIRAAAAVSAPQDLQTGALALSRGFSRLYCEHFLKTLRAKSVAKLERFPGLFDRHAVLACRNFFEFDTRVTAPLHGFRDCFDYWRRCSSGPFLRTIETPTLVLNAQNDPFLPAHVLAGPGEVSSFVQLDYPQSGGHVGFTAGPFPGRFDWLPQRLLQFFEHG